MKKINLLSILILTVCTLFAVNTFAQTSKDSIKNEKIVIDAKGGIHNNGGTKLGYITKDDVVKNNNGVTVYFIDRSGNIIDAKGTKLGTAKMNGDYYNNEGNIVLQVEKSDQEKCAILDPVGHNLGYVHKNYKLHACAAHCFFLQKKKDKAAKEKKAN
jgi:hypothetical protein